MPIEAPTAGPVITPTPSNFGAVAAQRAAAADPTTGLYQPSAGGNDVPRANSWSDSPRANGNGGDPAQTQRRYGGESMPTTGEHGQSIVDPSHGDPLRGDPDEGAPPPQPDDAIEPAEQLFDEQGNPIDMAEYNKQRAEVFGRIRQALDEGKFPFDELKNVPIELPGPNGQTMRTTLDELKSNGMRAADYTRKLHDVYQLRNQALSILQLEKARNNEWKDPAMLRQGLMMLGLGESLEKMVFEVAKERVDYLRLPPEQRALQDQLQAERMEKARLLEAHRQAQLRMQQQQGPDPQTMHVAKQIEQLMPRALRHVGVGQYPLSQQYFVNNLSVLCADGEVTPERAIQAAQATKEMLRELAEFNAQRGNQQVQRQLQPPDPFDQAVQSATGGYPLAPRRLATGSRPQLQLGALGAAGGGNGAAKPQGRRPSDFARRFG